MNRRQVPLSSLIVHRSSVLSPEDSMSRLLISVLAAAGLGGFALGWAVLSSPPEGPPQPSPPGPRTPAPGANVHRFPLGPADVRLDRETPALAVDARGRVLLAWASQSGEGERTLWLARSADGGAKFETPAAFRKARVHRYTAKMRGKEVAWSTSVAPRLAAGGEAIYLGWTESADGGPRVDFLTARTLDGGRTFGDPVPAHGPAATRPGFTALWAGADGALACAWLDHRSRAQHPFCSARPAGADRFSPEALVHAGPAGKGVCPCCDVAVLRAPQGDTFVAFRDNDEHRRDIRLARRPAGAEAFEAAVKVNPQPWRFEGCPHDGPALALSGGRLHVLWMDAHTGKRRVYHAASTLPELTFQPREVCPEAPGEQGHPRLVAAADGTLHAVWDASAEGEPAGAGHGGHQHGKPAGGGRAVMYARALPGADGFGPARALDPRPGAFQVNPVAAVGPAGEVHVAWAELTEQGKSIVCVRVPPPQ
jgi:hypothetical protein